MIIISTVSISCSYDEKNTIGIYSAPNTLKVLKNIKYKNKDSKFTFEASKGEYEGAQVIINPGLDIKSYELTLSDVKSEDGSVINKESFVAYKENYIKVDKKTSSNKNLPLGEYPDALIPLNLIYAKNENTIKAGENQGIWVTVKIPETAKGGLYRGEFLFNADGISHKIPVEITVFDFEIPKTVHSNTSYLIWRNILANGELDNTVDMYKNYYDFLLDYRICGKELPSNVNDIDSYMKSIIKYFDDPRVSTYVIPHATITAYDTKLSATYYKDIDYDILKKYIKAMAYKSTNERNLLGKAYLYLDDVVDEPNFRPELVPIVKKISKSLDELYIQIVKELTDEGYFNSNNGTIKNSILKIPNIITSWASDDLKNVVQTFCPLISVFDYSTDREVYTDIQNNRGNKVWWYNCVFPQNPYPSYHTDDNLISARIINWMQRDYKIDGNLYWCVNGFVDFGLSDGFGYKVIDTYEFVNRIPGRTSNGDGYILYPGKPYNSSKPIPSIRLEAIRDGQEDYEYLYLLEENYKKLKDFYRVNTLSSNDILNSLYSTLFAGTIPQINSNVFYEARNEVANLIVNSQSDMKFAVEKMSIMGDFATVSLLVNSDYTLTIEGVTPKISKAGSGNRYEFEINLNKENNVLNLVATKGQSQNAFSINISSKIEKLTDFDNASDLDFISVKGNTDVSKANQKKINKLAAYTINGNSAELTLSGMNFNNESQNKDFKSGFSLDLTKMSVNANALDNLTFSIFNAGEMLPMTISIRTNTDDQYILDNIKLKANSWNKINVSHLLTIDKSILDNASSIKFETDNMLDGEKIKTHKLFIDDIYYRFRRN
jgi:hypothetical protein